MVCHPFTFFGHKDQQKGEPTNSIPKRHSFRPWRFSDGIISRTEVGLWFAKKAPQRIYHTEWYRTYTSYTHIYIYFLMYPLRHCLSINVMESEASILWHNLCKLWVWQGIPYLTFCGIHFIEKLLSLCQLTTSWISKKCRRIWNWSWIFQSPLQHHKASFADVITIPLRNLYRTSCSGNEPIFIGIEWNL